MVRDRDGNVARAGPIWGNKVDKRAPDIWIDVPAWTSYLLYEAVPSSYACNDGGSGLASCAGPVANGAPIDTTSVGTRTFRVQATDGVGNSSEQFVEYQVNYQFSGFLAPVNGPPVVNIGRAGRTYPARWQLRSAVGYVSDLSAVTSLTYKATECAEFGGDPTEVLEVTATGGTALRL